MTKIKMADYRKMQEKLNKMQNFLNKSSKECFDQIQKYKTKIKNLEEVVKCKDIEIQNLQNKYDNIDLELITMESEKDSIESKFDNTFSSH